MCRVLSLRATTALLVLAVVVSAHWTHDDALAREIAPPAGVQDVDVAMLSDEIISAPGRKLLQSETVKQKVNLADGINQPLYSVNNAAKINGMEKHFATSGNEADQQTKDKVYRITIGTNWDYNGGDPTDDCSARSAPGPVNCQLEFSLEGEYTDGSTAIGDGNSESYKALRSYIGPYGMSYSNAMTMAAPLHPGMQAVIADSDCPSTAATNLPFCMSDMYGSGHFLAAPSGFTATGASFEPNKGCTPCEPNSKDCQAAVKKTEDFCDDSSADVFYRPAPFAGYLRTPDENNNINYAMKGWPRQMDTQDNMQHAWKPATIIQRGQISHPDVGTIHKVKYQLKPPAGASCLQAATQQAQNNIRNYCGKGWKGAFIKIDTNDPITGIGNGVYYMPVGTTTIDAPGKWGSGGHTPNTGPGSDGTQMTLDVENSEITRCMASTCEEEMDTNFGLA